MLTRRFIASKDSTESGKNRFLSGQSQTTDESSTLQRMDTNLDDVPINRLERLGGGGGDISVPKVRKGMLDKLSSGMVKNWRTRYFHLEEGIMTYFEPEHWYLKGEYDLYGLEFVEDPGDTPDLIRLRGPNSNICLRCKDERSVTRWRAAIAEHIEYANEKGQATSIGNYSTLQRMDSEAAYSAKLDVQYTTILPEPSFGWLRKKGQFIPSIKRRFFVLEAGVISYYKDDITQTNDDQSQGNNDSGSFKLRRNSTSARRVPKPLGKFSVHDYEVESDVQGGRIQIFIRPGPRSKSKRELMMYVEDYQERDQWVKALNSHALYQSV